MRRALPIVLAIVLVLPTVTGIASAQSPAQRLGGEVVVQEGETVNGFTAYAGTVIIRGTVRGDLTAFAGRVVIAKGGTVTGRLRAFAGSVRIAGTVGWNAVTYAGHVTLAENGQVNGSVGAFGGSALLAGQAQSDVTTVTGAVTLAPSGEVSGFLIHVGDMTDLGGTVTNEIRHVSDLSLLPPLTGPARFLIGIYLLFADAFTGGLLLYAFPSFARTAVTKTVEEPLRVGSSGVAVVISLPIAAVIATLSIIGIPLAIVGLIGYVIILWIGSIYGRFLVGAGLLSFTDVQSPYLALLAGIVTLAILALIPFLGLFIRVGVTLFGVGVIAIGLFYIFQSVRGRSSGSI